MANITGTSGNDTLDGTSGDDVLLGLDGDDVLRAGGGNDVLTGGAGADTLTGGPGSDVFRDTRAGLDGDTITDYGTGDTIVFTDVPYGPDPWHWLLDSQGILHVYFGTSGYTIALPNFEPGGGGQAIRLPDGGVEFRLDALPPVTNIDGTAGDDTLNGTMNRDLINAGSGNDTVFGDDGDDKINGDDGNDTLRGGQGNDIVHGGAGDDTIVVSVNAWGQWEHQSGDRYYGDGGTDTLYLTYPFTYQGNPLDLTAMQVVDVEILRTDLPILLTASQLQQFASGFSGFITLTTSGTVNLPNAVFETGRLTLADGDDLLNLSGGTPITASYRAIYAGGGNDQITAGNGDDNLFGGSGNDYLDGGAGNDYFEDGAGDDVMIGGDGVDVFYSNFQTFSGADRVDGGAGYDSLSIDGQYLGAPLTLANITGIENLSATYGYFAMTAQEANAFGVLKLYSLKLTTAGAVSLGPNLQVIDFELSDFGNTLNLSAGSLFQGHNITGGAGNDLVIGSASNEIISGGGGNDEIHGGDGDDTLSGGPGLNWVDGGTGNDLLLIAAGAALSAGDHYSGGAGYDTLQVEGPSYAAAADISLATIDADIERIIGSTITLTAAQARSFQSFQAALRLTTGGAVDFSNTDFSGNIYLSDFGNQITASNQVPYGLYAYGGAGNDTVIGAGGADQLRGAGGSDILVGGAGDDQLDGGTGVDSMTGGAGRDTYGVDDAGDVVIEVAGGGYDTVLATATFAIGAGSDIEELDLLGTAAIDAYGNELANLLVGNSGNNILDGRAGADVMRGAGGNDTYVVDNAGDVIDEAFSGGMDTVLSSVSFDLTPFVENITLTGAAAINATGNTLNNVIRGNTAANGLFGGSGDDTLLGGMGGDMLAGGEGSDTYIGTRAELNGDTIVDFLPGDRIVISDASIANFTYTLSARTLTFNGGSVTFADVVPARITVSAAPEGGVQIFGIPNVYLVSSVPFDLNAINFNTYYVNATAASFQKNVNAILDGQIYPDAYGVRAGTRELDFLGFGFGQNASGAITSGTANVIGEFDVFQNRLLWLLEGVSISAPALYNTALTPANADELNLLQSALSGNDVIVLSPFADRINGFSGDDLITGGDGFDNLTGGSGNDAFKDTKSGLNGDTITDFTRGDRIVITDAAAGQTLGWSNGHLTYGSTSITLTNLNNASITATAAPQGGVQIAFGGPAIVVAGGVSAPAAQSPDTLKVNAMIDSFTNEGAAFIPFWQPQDAIL